MSPQPPRPNPAFIGTQPTNTLGGPFVNARATAARVGELLARGSAVELGTGTAGTWLYCGEVIDQSRTELFELGDRVMQYADHAPAGPFRDRMCEAAR